MRLPDVKIDTDYVKFGGGLDLATPVLSLPPGAALAAMNYEPGVFGGYARIDGYERVDGRPAPSSADYYYATMNVTGAISVGLQVYGATSGATAVVAYTSGADLGLTKMNGTFVNGETLKSGAGSLPLLLTMNYAKATVGTLTSAPVLNGAPTGLLDATMKNAAAAIYRTDIKPPPGSGPTRGTAIYKGVKYAWRDTLDGTAGAMWKSSAGGWQPVYLGFELAFTAVSTYQVKDGDTIVGNTSGATAVVARVVLEKGTFAGVTATGRYIFASQSGTFQANETVKVGTNLAVATVSGPATAITLNPGGRYETLNHNFFGSTDTLRMYGVDAKNRGFEFDGTTYVPIKTGMTVDTPVHLLVHKKQLIFSFLASSQNSGIGLPYQWTAVTGAAEIALGDSITGYAEQSGDVAILFARNSTSQLLGSTVDDFILKPLSPKEGAIPYSVQTLSYSYYFDDAGVRQIRPSQDYGNFNNQTITQGVQAVINALRSKVIASTLYRMRGQYRVYGNDGSGLIIGVKGTVSAFGQPFQQVIGITTFQYPVNVTCACSGEDDTGADVAFFGDDQGYVYQGDRGSSFDGQDIEAYLILPFNNLKTPRLRKRFRKVAQEMSAVGYAAIRFQPIFSYGSTDIASHPFSQLATQGAGGYWDVNNWDQFYWDAPIVSTPEFDVNGTGVNLGLVYYSKSSIDLGHTLQGALIHYTPRRLSR